jgi:hypothetical protein
MEITRSGLLEIGDAAPLGGGTALQILSRDDLHRRRPPIDLREDIVAVSIPSQAEQCVSTPEVEFYEINEAVPIPKLDRDGTQLPLDSLTSDQRNYNELSAQLSALLASAPNCPGDGNIDSAVNQEDLANWAFYNQSWGLSSVYDLNFDGLTDAADRTIIEQNLGLTCRVHNGSDLKGTEDKARKTTHFPRRRSRLSPRKA